MKRKWVREEPIAGDNVIKSLPNHILNVITYERIYHLGENFIATLTGGKVA